MADSGWRDVPGEAEAAEALRREAERVRPADLGRLLGRADELIERVQRFGPLRVHAARVRVMLRLLADHRAGRAPGVPWPTVAAVAAGLLYLLNPFDLVPDAIPVLGQIDDALVLGLLWRAVALDLRRYAEARWPTADEASRTVFAEAFPDLSSGALPEEPAR